MRRIALSLLLVAPAALGQAPPQTAGETAAERSRAPLAAVEDLEPAVDVGAVRVAMQQPAPAASPPVAPSIAAPAAPSAQAAPRPSTSRVVDTLDLGTTSITGNQELPKVLYIVPWKKSDLGDLVGRPVNTLLDEVLTPVDPEVFERHLSYYESLHGVTLKE